MTRVLITGATGQIGSALAELAPAAVQVAQAARSMQSGQFGEYAVDLSRAEAVRQLLADTQPDIIINAAAWTDVDGAEQQPEAAEILNAQLPVWLAGYAGQNNRLLVHYSTDYVFAGTKTGPYNESDSTDPTGVYGQTKLAGERAILSSEAPALILRTSWVYGGPTGNFLSTIAGKLMAGDRLRVVNDQHGCPTWSRDIAACTWHAVERLWPVQQGFKPAVYHLAGADDGSWFDYARHIETELARLELLTHDPQIDSHVSACTSAEYPRPAPRPANSRLDSRRFRQTFDCHPRGWNAVRECLRHITANSEGV